MTWKALFQSQLLHFFLLGGCIFAAYVLVEDTPPSKDPDAIVLAAEDAARMVGRFEQAWGRPPTLVEMDGMLHAWAVEEAYVREATALGLDRGDPVIRQRLALKMRFLAEGAGAVLDVDDATLQAHLDANAGAFRRPPQLAFQQVPTDPDDGPALLAALKGGADPTVLAGAGLLPTNVNLTRAPVIDRTFGTGFADQLIALPSDSWQGPVDSAYGQHLVRVTGYTAGRIPALSEIREQVEEDWRAAQARESRDAFAEALLARYSVVLPEAGDVLSR